VHIAGFIILVLLSQAKLALTSVFLATFLILLNSSNSFNFGARELVFHPEAYFLKKITPENSLSPKT
jgi:hypothetical protein